MRVFKAELREALRDPSRIPDDELSESVEYDDGSDEAFLRRLWHDLYGDRREATPRGRRCTGQAGAASHQAGRLGVRRYVDADAVSHGASLARRSSSVRHPRA